MGSVCNKCGCWPCTCGRCAPANQACGGVPCQAEWLLPPGVTVVPAGCVDTGRRFEGRLVVSCPQAPANGTPVAGGFGTCKAECCTNIQVEVDDGMGGPQIVEIDGANVIRFVADPPGPPFLPPPSNPPGDPVIIKIPTGGGGGGIPTIQIPGITLTPGSPTAKAGNGGLKPAGSFVIPADALDWPSYGASTNFTITAHISDNTLDVPVVISITEITPSLGGDLGAPISVVLGASTSSAIGGTGEHSITATFAPGKAYVITVSAPGASSGSATVKGSYTKA